MIRVVVVDDHALIRDGLTRNLDRAADIEIVGEAGTISEARAVIRHQDPDVVVLDIRLTDGNGIDLCSELSTQADGPAVVILSMYAEPARIEAARAAGAAAFIGKDAPVADLAEAVRDVATGRQRFPATSQAHGDGSAVASLTPRERDVLALLAQGLSVSQISGRLFISESTTKTHVAKIYSKLGAANRAQALMTAVRVGLVTAPQDDF